MVFMHVYIKYIHDVTCWYEYAGLAVFQSYAVLSSVYEVSSLWCNEYKRSCGVHMYINVESSYYRQHVANKY